MLIVSVFGKIAGMTIRSSFVFEEPRNAGGARTEGAYLQRVFITDRKITLYNKKLVKTAKSGVLFEQIVGQQTFSLHENSHGDKYIKRFNKSLSGSITDTSLDVAMRSYNSDTFIDSIIPASRELIETTILGWFDPLYQNVPLRLCQKQLFFPALRDQSFPQTDRFNMVLAELQLGTAMVTKALRANNSWDSFVADLCKTTVKTESDLRIVQQYPEELLPLAVMNLGCSVSSLNETHNDSSFATLYEASGRNWGTVLACSQAFNIRDQKYLSFMLKYLPVSQKQEALSILLKLTAHHEEEKKGVKFDFQRSSFIDPRVSFSSVPSKHRAELASAFFDQLQRRSENLSLQETLRMSRKHVSTGLDEVFKHWIASKFLPMQMQSKATVEDVEQRFEELFGVPLDASLGKSLGLISNKGIIYCSIAHRYAFGKLAAFSTDVITSLNHLVVKNRPKEKGVSGMNGYLGDNQWFQPIYGELYSLDDLMELIEKGAKETDKHLTKLGREITPQNRIAFLTLGSKERKFKNTWKFYDWGVTDAARILEFKISKVTKKNDVQNYNALPDDMFYELLALESGKEHTTTSY